MRPISYVDQLFLWLERENQPMHVGGLLLLAPPDGAGPTFVRDLVAEARKVTIAHAPFNRRAVRKLGRWYWEEVEAIDVDRHLFTHVLSSPGSDAQLSALVSELHARPLDRAKPLWELHVVEGLEGGRVAIYSKMHHALVDGMAAQRILLRALSSSPDAGTVTPFWAQPPRSRSTPPPPMRGWERLAGAAEFGAELAKLPNVLRELGRSLRRDEAGNVTPFDAPRSILNQRVGPTRTFASTSWSLERLRAAAHAHGVTVNDVVLATCSAGLRRYLDERGALPDEPLVAMVPVALEASGEGGNDVTLLLADLATDVPDPLPRLEAIVRSVRIGKERVARLSRTENLAFASASVFHGFARMATGVGAERQAFNVVVSNVPGPKTELFYAGARVEHIVPVSIALDGQALNLTVASYAGRLELGIVACPRALPDVERLVGHLDAGLAELEAKPVRRRIPPAPSIVATVAA